MTPKLIILACLTFGPLASLQAATLTATVTQTHAGEWHSPTPTPTVTQTAGWTMSYTPSPTASRTATPTVTPTASPFTPVQADAILIDDFEDGDLFSEHGGAWTGIQDAGGSAVTILDASGCPYGTVIRSLRASGSCNGTGAGQFAGLQLGFGSGINLSAPALAQRQLGFRAYSAAPVTLTVEVMGPGGPCAAQVYLDGSGWQDFSIATPDHAAPGDLPQFSNSAGWAATIAACTGIRFLVRHESAGTLPFDFQVDDLQWQGFAGGPSPTRLAAIFGVNLATVVAAQAYGLNDHGLWTLLVLARRCGCSPADIMDQRATRSWGQVAELHGTTWAALLVEMEADASSGSIVPEMGDWESLERILRNGPPTLAPLPTPTPYVPPGPVALPTAGPC